jgi:hypothetical protein
MGVTPLRCLFTLAECDPTNYSDRSNARSQTQAAATVMLVACGTSMWIVESQSKGFFGPNTAAQKDLRSQIVA